MRTFLLALLTAAAGLVLAFLVADFATRAHGVSDFEGQRAYAVVFLFAPAGLLLGLLIGLLVARRGGLGGFPGQLGVALLITAGTIAIAGAGGYVTAPRQPLIDGRPLQLDFELRLPPDRAMPADTSKEGFAVSLYAGSKDNDYADLDFAAASRSEGRVVLPGSAPLNTTSARRMLTVADGRNPAYGFDLPLRGAPRSADEAWTDWLPRARHPGFDGFQVRYRVRKVAP